MEAQLDERLISGVGLLRVPPPSQSERYYSILVDVIRSPTRMFPSDKYSPQRQRYATMTYLRNGYVIAEMYIDYPRRRYDMVVDVSAQNLIAIKCAYQGILTTFFNLGNALDLPSLSVTDQVKAFSSLNLMYDSVQFCCEGDTAIQVRLLHDTLDTCNPETPKSKVPPPPAPPHASVPAGTPITTISPPYDTSDTVTAPNQLDIPEPPPTAPGTPHGVAGVLYTVDFYYDLEFPSGAVVDHKHSIYSNVPGPILDYGVSDNLVADGYPTPGGYTGSYIRAGTSSSPYKAAKGDGDLGQYTAKNVTAATFFP